MEQNKCKLERWTEAGKGWQRNVNPRDKAWCVGHIPATSVNACK